jgi:hypothetical protein
MFRRALLAVFLGALLVVGPSALAKGADRDEQPAPAEQPKGEEQKSKGEQPREDTAKDEGARSEGRTNEDEGDGEGDGDRYGDGRYRYGDGRYGYGRGYYYEEPTDSSHFIARMTGDQEVPKKGPAGGRGLARLDVDPYEHRVCYELSYEGIGKLTGGHIHRGEQGTSGPAVVNFDVARNGDRACVPGNPRVLRDMQAQPQHYYVNLHTAEHPDGAIRGQVDYPTG